MASGIARRGRPLLGQYELAWIKVLENSSGKILLGGALESCILGFQESRPCPPFSQRSFRSLYPTAAPAHGLA
jgi:hypothetical protein